jgi:hypothetical protein
VQNAWLPNAAFSTIYTGMDAVTTPAIGPTLAWW